jgi:hypothetical protein
MPNTRFWPVMMETISDPLTAPNGGYRSLSTDSAARNLWKLNASVWSAARIANRYGCGSCEGRV